MSASEVWLVILGGFLATFGGLLLFFVQHLVERRAAKRAAEAEALRQFREELMPLLIELDRWRYSPVQTAVWVGASRQLPRLNTWIFDPEENASKPPNWEAIGRRAQGVERLWRDRLSARVSDGAFEARWVEISELLFHVSRRDGANPRSAAEQAEAKLLALLESIAAFDA